MDCNPSVLGNCLFRVLLAGSCKPHGNPELHAASAQNHSRGCHIGCVFRIWLFLYESAAEIKLSLGVLLFTGRRIFYISRLVFAGRIYLAPSKIHLRIKATSRSVESTALPATTSFFGGIKRISCRKVSSFNKDK